MIKIYSSFFCDDVRQEITGKLIFIGAYTQDIVIPAFPHRQTIYLVISGVIDDPNPFSIEIETLLNGERLSFGQLQLQTARTGFVLLPIPTPIEIIKAGMVVMRIKEKVGKWREAGKIEIKLASPGPQPVPSPNV